MNPIFPSVFLTPNAIQTNVQKLMGRQSAGRGFVRALSAAYRHSEQPMRLVHGGGAEESVLAAEVRSTGWQGLIEHQLIKQPEQWCKAGVLYYPAPMNNRIGWQRSRLAAPGLSHLGSPLGRL